MPAMTDGLALGAALHFDHELAGDPQPFATVVCALFGERSDGEFRQFIIPDAPRKGRPPVPLNLEKLVERINEGTVATASVGTGPHTPDPDEMRISASTVREGRPSRSLTKCRYNFSAELGANRLRELGAQRVLDLLIAFADAVAARAGVVQWASSTVYAACLAMGGGSDRLTKAQNSHVSDLLYWQPRWGDVIRGPQWGTFLGAAHVTVLGGIGRIERESGCARVVALASGGAFLQATPIDQPIVEETDDGGVLARLSEFLAPVMGKR
jgi:hypothetical protein